MIPKRGVDMPEFHLPQGVSALCQILRERGYEAYPVGGCVRDLLLGRVPGDWDVTTSAPPERVIELFEHTIPTGIQHGTVTVLQDSESIEVTTFRKESGYSDGRHPGNVTFDAGLEEDLSRRDFTINAMALDERGRVIDLFGGQVDLMAKLVRCVGEPDLRFTEDALRMYRAVRFSAQLGFTIAEETAAAIGRNAHRAAKLSGERVKSELEKTLLSTNPERVGRAVEWGLLDHLFCSWPEKVDWEALRAAPATQIKRWRAFCTLTGFPIAALPTERALRRGVEHPELEALQALQVSGGELCALGLEGPTVSAMQRRLGAHITAHPGDNTREILLALAEEWKHEREDL